MPGPFFALDLSLATRGAPTWAGPVGARAFAAMPQAWRVMADVLLIAASGVFYIVPFQALVQERTSRDRRSQVIAAGNVLSALFMVAAAVLAIGLLRVGATIPELILLLALLNGVAALRVRGVGADGHCGVPRRSRTDGGAILTPRAAAIL